MLGQRLALVDRPRTPRRERRPSAPSAPAPRRRRAARRRCGARRSGTRGAVARSTRAACARRSTRSRRGSARRRRTRPRTRRRVGHAAAGEEPREDLRPRGVEPGVDALVEGRARRDGEELRQPVAERGGRPRTARSAPRIGDVRVDAERVVAPDDVPEDLVVPAVVGRVDDPLVAPARPGVRARRAEREAERLDERRAAALGARRARAGTSANDALLPRLDLDLRGDQLADEVRLEHGVPAPRPAPPRSG